MRINSILFLPVSILILIAPHTTSANSAHVEQLPGQWQRSIEAEGSPNESIYRRQQVEEHLSMGRAPVGVMKMSPDEGEKFYMEYWQFEGDARQSSSGAAAPTKPLEARAGEEERLLANGSTAVSFRPPFALHIGDRGDGYHLWARRAIEAARVLAILEKRDSACPTGTVDCSSIGHPNSCCSTDEDCFVIEDTGLGSVGCCPKGATCGGTITHCNAPNSPCPADLGGGCCIPNFTCEGVGCVFYSTAVTTVVVPPSLSNSASSSVAIPPSTHTTAIASSSPSPTSTPSTPSTNTGVAPVRPTSGLSITSTTSATAAPTNALCPTGFYACSAYYQGGCCRVGRNCEKTSCPATSSTTIISSGRTIVVPVGPAATVNSPMGACATGWASCAPSDGGNCCPSGWQCGTASCSSISASSTAEVQKGSPSLGTRKGVGIWVCIGVCLTLVLIML